MRRKEQLITHITETKAYLWGIVIALVTCVITYIQPAALFLAIFFGAIGLIVGLSDLHKGNKELHDIIKQEKGDK